MVDVRRSAHMNVMIEAAEKAGRGLLRDFGEVENLQVSRKGPGNFVSVADIKAEKTVKAILQKARPRFGFLMEESGAQTGEDAATRWIVDPLDGTTNFLHGVPHWCVSIALEKEADIVAGVIYDPVKDEMFWAEKGTGAYLNNKRIQVAARTGLPETLISTDLSAPLPLPLQGTGIALRDFGSACLNLAYVAAGRADAHFQAGLHAWDKAAGALIVKEARGTVSDAAGGKDFVHGNGIVAANAAIHGALLKALGKAAVFALALFCGTAPAQAQFQRYGSGLPAVELNLDVLETTPAAPALALPESPARLLKPSAPPPVVRQVAGPLPLRRPAPPEKPVVQKSAPLPETPFAAVRRPEPARPPAAPKKPAAVPALADLTLPFDGDSGKVPSTLLGRLDAIVTQMKEADDTRLQVRAYATGEDGNASSARRISLSRALSVRGYMMDMGIKPTRIDVRALGAESDRAPLDRVDLVFVR